MKVDISKEDQEAFVGKLTRLTQEEKLKWDKSEPYGNFVLEGNSKLRGWYETVIEKRTLVIYEEAFQAVNPETDQYYWDTNVVLALLDYHGVIDWQFPPVPGLWDLLREVQYRNSGVEEFVNLILDKPSE